QEATGMQRQIVDTLVSGPGEILINLAAAADRITGPDTPVHPLLDVADLLPAMQLTRALTDSALRSELSRLKGEAVDTAPMAQVLPVYSRLAGLALPGLEGFSTAEASDAVASRPLSAGVISPADWPAARELVSRVAR